MFRWKNAIGATVAMLVMAVVLYLYGGDLKSVDFTRADLLPRFAGAVAIYTFVVAIGAFAWGVLLTAFGARPSFLAAERQLLISQIGKYIPGNVAQYVGRAAMAIGAGMPAGIVGLALVTETAAIILGGMISVAISVAIAPEQANRAISLLPDISALGWIAAGIAAFLLLLLALHLASKQWSRFEKLPKVRWGHMIFAIALYTCALLLLGGSLNLIAGALSPVPLSLTVVVFSAAWIAGLATPGAPGGLGVRETVIALGLAPFMGGAAALSAALLHRGASVLGDVISLGLGLAIPKVEEES
jgi:glycosyltransferase 2 family protein